jgi:hypothetical protein
MRVSEYYSLGRTQPTLDFVDVDVRGDAKVFVDPRALRLLPSVWASECVALVQDFFRKVLNDIHCGNNGSAQSLLSVLREPNETHLGLSRGRARGRGLGSQSAMDVWRALSQSEAVRSGLLEDLEDTILMVEGISSDIISDITTNIIRGPLIAYTQQMAKYYGVPLDPGLNSGPLWNPQNQQWDTKFVDLPRTRWGKLLLVPKAIVRRRMDYDATEYYRHYLLEHLQQVELSANTELVQLLKNGRSRVTKKDLITKYGSNKAALIRETKKYPEVLERYRRDKQRTHKPPLDHLDIADIAETPRPDWDTLLRAVLDLPPGRDESKIYETAIESLLSAIFYPSLAYPCVELEIHEGRKRIDISYTNLAVGGFFYWLALHYSAPNIFVECKNYVADLKNPELDQISSRFSPSRGQVGILVCRRFSDKDLFIKRCIDTALDQRGFVIVLDDEDLVELVRERRQLNEHQEYSLLRKRFDNLIM